MHAEHTIRWAWATYGLPLALSMSVQGASWQWHEVPGRVTLATADGKPVWSFHYGPDASKPFFHPVAVAGGPSLVELRPPDHPWHLGLWFSWKFINGVNYWEEDKSTGRAQGKTEILHAKVQRQEDGSVRIELRIAYHPPEQPAVLVEDRRIAVSAPAADGGWKIDWDATFQAQQRVVLETSPVNPQKTAGGYGGLSLRIAHAMEQWQAVDDQGRRDLAIHGEPARAVEFSGVLGGQAAGIAVLDHPTNPGAPSSWFLRFAPDRKYGFTGPGLLFRQPITLDPGATLHLVYRVIIHPGRWGADELLREWKSWAAPQGS